MLKKEYLRQLNVPYAHRGLHSKPEIPENSMAAFRRAVDEGFGIEMDVHLTADHKLAIIHDSSLKRTAGVDLEIEKITLEEAQKYPLEASDERICEFKDFLNMVDGKVPLLIELKSVGGNDHELVARVMEDLKHYLGLYSIESFYPFTLKELRKDYNKVVRGQLAGHVGTETDVSKFEDFMLRNLLVNAISKPDYVAYRFEDREIKAFKNSRKAKFCWTIRNYEDYKVCLANGWAPIFEKFNPKDYK